MKVSKLPPTVSKIYNKPSTRWLGLLKDVSSEELCAVVRRVIKDAKENEIQAWDLASFALAELGIRKWGKTHTKELEAFRKVFSRKVDNCILDDLYSLELTGIGAKAVKPHTKSSEVYHPYPLNLDVYERILKWRKSKTSKPLDHYVATHLTAHQKKKLILQSVSYLSPKQQKIYDVAFKNGKMRIGNKRPEGGSYIFALSSDGNSLLAGSKRKGKFQHTSFFAGAPVQCAGKFQVKHAKIVSVDLTSGHYKPKKVHGKNLIQYLKENPSFGEKRARKISIHQHK